MTIVKNIYALFAWSNMGKMNLNTFVAHFSSNVEIACFLSKTTTGTITDGTHCRSLYKYHQTKK